MNILGVEFAGSNLNYVLIVCAAGECKITRANRLVLSDTRSREALRSFQTAVGTILNEAKPDLIAVKDKPEAGAMRAGAAALKMEGIMLALANSDVDFVSGKRINACEDGEGIKAYHQLAFKAALAAFLKQTS